MKAVRFHGARDIRVEDVAEPTARLGAHDVLIKPITTGICGTDLHEYIAGPIVTPSTPHVYTGATNPQILGHEFSAVVADTGSAVTNVKAGDRVSIQPLISPRDDYFGRRGLYHLSPQMACVGLSWAWGGMGELAIVNDYNVVPVPKGVSDVQAAMIEPAAVAIYGTDRGGVTAVRLRLSRAPRPVRYAELARTLGVQVGDPAPATAVRQAVLDLRRGKGMVLDPNDPDTRSVGSFFTNPIVTDAELAIVRSAVTARLGPDATVPRYPAEGGSKLSAAWLIERAGFGKGYPGATDPAARITVSGKHTLALTNRGGGSTAELIALARTIRNGVRDAFAVTLTPEPVLVGVGLD